MLKIEWKNQKGNHIAQGEQIIIRDGNNNIIGIFIDFGGGNVMFAHAADKDFLKVLKEAGIKDLPQIKHYKSTKTGLIVPD